MFHSQLTEPYVLEYAYERSTGPVVGRFLTALREGRIEGLRAADGRVLVPPAEYDPDTGAALEGAERVEVGTAGTIVTWSWIEAPRPSQPLDRPFAWALIRLDGADTAMLHAVDAPRADVHTGMRVQVRWAAERTGTIRDIACFEPEAAR